MKQQLLVDMDGVLADVYAQFLRMEYEELGIKRSLKDLEGILEMEVFANAEKYVRSKGFFRTAPVIEGSIEGLRYLNDKYNVLIVSSATEFPDSLSEKLYWLNEHYPFITWQQMIFCGKKDSVKGDIMIDDHPKNLDYFDGKTIMFTQPHNAKMDNGKHIRANNWQEVINLL
ncbi:5'-nucleotidase [Prevotella sp. 10(H)]|uniref:5' nucleotidase, NT5C type n=1 Tax=Prevotella sp. 10(H) TaxID=1158294 RepID=UPI0004A6E781|nr:5'-nucleotidase [Prevotella sp. 10(H)]